jgi:hypothetical protein
MARQAAVHRGENWSRELTVAMLLFTPAAGRTMSTGDRGRLVSALVLRNDYEITHP